MPDENETPNLWPPLPAPLEPTPSFVLREAASQLAGMTKGVVTAEVVSRESRTTDPWEFVHSFDFVAPALNNYRYRLFRAQHGISLYPVQILFQGTTLAATDRAELHSLLKRIFSDDHTQKVLQSLLSQSQAVA